MALVTHDDKKDSLDDLEESIKKLKVYYELFFAGARKLPPTEDRKRLDVLIHEVAKEKMRDNARRFRFNTLVGRYNQFRELWSRKMREREEGPIEFRKRKQALDEPVAPRETPQRTERRVTSQADESYVTVTSSNGNDAIRALHAQISAAQAELGGKAGLSLEQVSSMVQKQAENLRERYGVNAIAFRVDTSEGKVKLKAKPVQGQK